MQYIKLYTSINNLSLTCKPINSKEIPFSPSPNISQFATFLRNFTLLRNHDFSIFKYVPHGLMVTDGDLVVAALVLVVRTGDLMVSGGVDAGEG